MESQWPLSEELVVKSSPVLEQEPDELISEAEVDSHVASKSGAVEANRVDVVCQVPHMVQCHVMSSDSTINLSLIHISEPTRRP